MFGLKIEETLEIYFLKVIKGQKQYNILYSITVPDEYMISYCLFYLNTVTLQRISINRI
jgi:hypothetical protein